MVEIVCQSVADAINATKGGAGRIELCSALPLGGLTPTIGLLAAVKAVTPLPIMAMVRPRPGGFYYSDEELKVMEADARLLIQNGADGIVFGCLTEEGAVDIPACRRLVAVAEGHQTVFHRAFDCVSDLPTALNHLIALGITRILTSGGRGTAIEGAATIASLIHQANGHIEILPGGGIRAHNVRELVTKTGANQVHLAPLKAIPETLPFDFGAQATVDPDAVRAVIYALN